MVMYVLLIMREIFQSHKFGEKRIVGNWQKKKTQDFQRMNSQTLNNLLDSSKIPDLDEIFMFLSESGRIDLLLGGVFPLLSGE